MNTTSRILGKPSQYYVQTNNAQVELFRDYFQDPKMISCGPTAAAICLDVAGWPMDVFTPGEQPEDAILMVANNPNNLKLLKDVRDVDYDKYPPHEVPQIYEVVTRLIYKRGGVCSFQWGLSYDIIRANIIGGRPMMICGQFPVGGHYVAAVGFDDGDRSVIFNDPYPPQWHDRRGYNRRMSPEFLEQKIQGWRIDFAPAP